MSIVRWQQYLTERVSGPYFTVPGRVQQRVREGKCRRFWKERLVEELPSMKADAAMSASQEDIGSYIGTMLHTYPY